MSEYALIVSYHSNKLTISKDGPKQESTSYWGISGLLDFLAKIVTKRSFKKWKLKKCIGVKYEREESEFLGASAFKATSPVHTPKGVKHLQSHGTQVN